MHWKVNLKNKAENVLRYSIANYSKEATPEIKKEFENLWVDFLLVIQELRIKGIKIPEKLLIDPSLRKENSKEVQNWTERMIFLSHHENSPAQMIN